MAKPKYVQARKMRLLVPISTTETGSIQLDQFKDIYGNTLAASTDFTAAVYLTINPGGSNEEIISFTDGTQNTDGTYTITTGITRHLAAKSPYDNSGTAQAHAGGETVVVSNEPEFYKAITDYVDSLALAAAVQSSKTAFGYTKQTETNQNARVRSTLVSQRSSPNLTVAVIAFSMGIGAKHVQYTGGNSPAATAPVSNPRIDLIVYDTVNTIIALRTGTEAASPSAPTPTTGDIVLAAVQHRVGSTKILEEDDSTNSYILRHYEPDFYDSGTYVSSTSGVLTADADQSQATQNGTVAVGEADATTKKVWITEKFIPTITSIRGFKFYKAADTGTFTGTVTMSLQADTSGAPSGSDLVAVTLTNAAWTKIATGEFSVGFTEYSTLTVGSSYWIVIKTSTTDTSNHPNFGINTAGGYANGLLRYHNSTDASGGWVTVSTSILYFKTLQGILAKFVKTDPSTGQLYPSILPYSLVELNNYAGNAGQANAETTVYQILLPAGFFSLNSGFRLRGAVETSTGGTSKTLTLNIRLNGTSVGSITTPQVANSNSLHDSLSILEFIFVNSNSLAAQKTWGTVVAFPTNFVGTFSSSSTPQMWSVLNTTTAFDTSVGAIYLQLTATGDGTVTTNWGGVVLEKIG